jgi:hypothetical protein
MKSSDHPFTLRFILDLEAQDLLDTDIDKPYDVYEVEGDEFSGPSHYIELDWGLDEEEGELIQELDTSELARHFGIPEEYVILVFLLGEDDD